MTVSNEPPLTTAQGARQAPLSEQLGARRTGSPQEIEESNSPDPSQFAKLSPEQQIKKALDGPVFTYNEDEGLAINRFNLKRSLVKYHKQLGRIAVFHPKQGDTKSFLAELYDVTRSSITIRDPIKREITELPIKGNTSYIMASPARFGSNKVDAALKSLGLETFQPYKDALIVNGKIKSRFGIESGASYKLCIIDKEKPNNLRLVDNGAYFQANSTVEGFDQQVENLDLQGLLPDFKLNDRTLILIRALPSELWLNTIQEDLIAELESTSGNLSMNTDKVLFLIKTAIQENQEKLDTLGFSNAHNGEKRGFCISLAKRISKLPGLHLGGQDIARIIGWRDIFTTKNKSTRR